MRRRSIVTKTQKAIASDLKRLDATPDEHIDYSDAPQPDLAEWVRSARLFVHSDENGAGVDPAPLIKKEPANRR